MVGTLGQWVQRESKSVTATAEWACQGGACSYCIHQSPQPQQETTWEVKPPNEIRSPD